jgi:RNA polymerase sigma factor (sigma-70 family)
MNSDELNLWTRCREGDDAVRKELVLLYLPLAIFWAKKISMSAGWANTEDLKQEGIIGLIKAVERFDPSRGVSFKAFARSSICGAIFDSSEFTRGLARLPKENYRKIRRAEVELSNAMQRNPTIEEVAEKTDLTIKQISNSLDAIGVASAVEIPDLEDAVAVRMVETPDPESTIMLLEAISRLSAREQEIIRLYYWEDQSPEEIAQRLGMKASNATKIRQRANDKIGKLLDARGRGGQDE